MIYYKMQMYFLNDSNNCKTWWNTSHILNMNWLYHFNYNWKVRVIWFHKKHLDKFFIQMSISMLKNTFCWKFTFIWKMTIIILEVFLSKPILYVYQNTSWNNLKTTPKIYPPKYIFLLKIAPPPMCFHPLQCYSKGTPIVFWTHDGFQLGLFAISFVHNGIIHSTKYFQVCQLVMTHAIGTVMWWRSNTINVKKWYFTSLVPNVTSMEIALLWLN